MRSASMSCMRKRSAAAKRRSATVATWTTPVARASSPRRPARTCFSGFATSACFVSPLRKSPSGRSSRRTSEAAVARSDADRFVKVVPTMPASGTKAKMPPASLARPSRTSSSRE